MQRAVHRFATATAATTWVLLMVGCMVHGTGSSLACPDWPTCYGTFFPEMKNGVEFEHGHRLVATLVGLMTVVQSVLLWVWAVRSKSPRARATAWFGVLAAFLVVVQGVLGGITVLFKLPIGVTLSHLAISVSFFSLLGWIALRTSERSAEAVEQAATSLGTTADAARRLRTLLSIGGLVALGQIVLGGIVRHTHNGLACYQAPICEDGLWPAHLGQKIQMGHRYLGTSLALWIVAVAVIVFRRTAAGSILRKLAVAQVALVLTQVGLGLWIVWGGLPLPQVTAHMGVAAAILMSHVVMVVLLARAVPVPVQEEVPATAADGSVGKAATA